MEGGRHRSCGKRRLLGSRGLVAKQVAVSLPPSLTHSLTPSLSRALSLAERESARAHTHMCVCVCVCVHACMRACVFALDELILTLDRVLTEVQRSSPSAPAGLRAR